MENKKEVTIRIKRVQRINTEKYQFMSGIEADTMRIPLKILARPRPSNLTLNLTPRNLLNL